jgi:hypothetical protein
MPLCLYASMPLCLRRELLKPERLPMKVRDGRYSLIHRPVTNLSAQLEQKSKGSKGIVIDFH